MGLEDSGANRFQHPWYGQLASRYNVLLSKLFSAARILHGRRAIVLQRTRSAIWASRLDQSLGHPLWLCGIAALRRRLSVYNRVGTFRYGSDFPDYFIEISARY